MQLGLPVLHKCQWLFEVNPLTAFMYSFCIFMFLSIENTFKKPIMSFVLPLFFPLEFDLFFPLNLPNLFQPNLL